MHVVVGVGKLPAIISIKIIPTLHRSTTLLLPLDSKNHNTPMKSVTWITPDNGEATVEILEGNEQGSENTDIIDHLWL